jgi:GT2 family glycosyltransferase
MNKPTISICTVVCRNLNDIVNFVCTVGWNTSEPFELIIVSNNCTEDILSFLKSIESPNIKVIYNKENVGIGTGMMQAMRESQTDHIFRTDSDVLVSCHWTTKLMNRCDHEDIGSVGTVITCGNRKNNGRYVETDFQNSSCMYIPRRTITKIDLALAGIQDRVIRKAQADLATYNEKYPGFKSHLRSLISYMQTNKGYWDPGFMYGADDMDYSLMIRYAGLKLAIAPDVIIIHHKRSEDPEFAEVRHKTVMAGFQYFRCKWERILDYYGDVSTGGWKDTWECLPINRKYFKDMCK